jgi:tRNA-binding EMAP/Myf-like protein
MDTDLPGGGMRPDIYRITSGSENGDPVPIHPARRARGERIGWGARVLIHRALESRPVNVSENLLRSRIPTLPADVEEIAGRLRDAGLAVSRTVPLAELLRPVVVARVESVAQHPNADRLKVCVVNDGSEQTLQIVTGASNVTAGAYYPVIRSGVTLPGGIKIKRGKLRGEESQGMLGSADELELGTDHAGLMTLPGEPVPGTPLPEVMEIPGVVFVIDGNPELDEIVRALGEVAAKGESEGEAKAE